MKAMILAGEGINCEEETKAAFLKVGIEADIIYIQEWKQNPERLFDYQILALPGGFSFGDELHSGQILALDLKYSVGKELKSFSANKGLVIGICNGFQVLMKLGIFENSNDRTMTLYHNESFKFQDQWVKCLIPESRCVWTKGMSAITLPARHGEGRIIFKEEKDFDAFAMNGQIALVYDRDINGSHARIAGITDPTGQVLGLMPHPEAALDESLYPHEFKQNPELVLALFQNAKKFIQENI